MPEPRARTGAVTAIDAGELAASLAKTAAALDRHIAAEATKRANRIGVQYAKAADERIGDAFAEHADEALAIAKAFGIETEDA